MLCELWSWLRLHQIPATDCSLVALHATPGLQLGCTFIETQLSHFAHLPGACRGASVPESCNSNIQV